MATDDPTLTLSTETLAASWYHAPAIYELERRAVFAREWLYAAHRSELRQPGDYVTLTLAGYPLLLLVGSDGVLRGFHNVCRHRASPLCTEPHGRLEGSAVVCRYHGWSYEHTGAFRSAPQGQGLCAEGLSLHGIQVADFDGLVFVNLDPAARPFQEAHAELIAQIRGSGYDLQRYQLHSRMTVEGDFNWKVWIEGFQECYHCATIHPIFNKDFQLRSYRVDNKDRYSVHACQRKVPSASGAFEGLWLWVHPNLGLPCYEPGYYTLQVIPLSASRTRLAYTFRFRPDYTAAEIDTFKAFVQEITREDVTVCERVQQNLAAGVFEKGVLVPERENGVQYFHALLRQALAR